VIKIREEGGGGGGGGGGYIYLCNSNYAIDALSDQTWFKTRHYSVTNMYHEEQKIYLCRHENWILC